ncbi:MAG: hypothetical protein RL329_2578 [Bacteroidota bacterium]|jgi:AraC-like DNA-binding protein
MQPKQTISTLSVFKNPFFDGFEIKNALFLNRAFPTHFHTHWSIALVKTGSENLYIDNQKLLIAANTLVLIPPYLPHSHDGQQEAFWAYQVLYFDETRFKKRLQNTVYDQKVVLNNQLVLAHVFQQFCLQLQENTFQLIHFEQFIHTILLDKNTIFIGMNLINHHLDFVQEIKQVMTHHLIEKITLDRLSQKFKIDKFNLMRQFKKATGLTPNDYLMALRIEESKQLMYKTDSLMDIAFTTGFYDQSHFYHCFKKYVGLSPTEYRQNLQYFTSPPE